MRPKSLFCWRLRWAAAWLPRLALARSWNATANPANSVETAPIYVAVHNINLGDPIDANMVSLQEWPKDKVPLGAVSQLEDLKGRRPRTAIIQGEPILDGKLLQAGSSPTRSVDSEGHAAQDDLRRRHQERRRFAQSWRSRRRPGLREARPTTASKRQVKVILQNIRVFAVDQTVQRAADGGEEHASPRRSRCCSRRSRPRR